MPFRFYQTDLPEVLLIEPRVFEDERGFFLESYKATDFEAAGITAPFVQDNHSSSRKGVLRGIHYQLPPYAQGKLVRTVVGRAFDVAVDLRKSSRTFGDWVGLELSAENNRMLYIPPGFGHGFLSLEEETHFVYKCTAEYDRESERGVKWDDPELAIEWPEPRPSVSPKDAVLPLLSEAELFR